MSRNDSVLYTGASSASFSSVKEQQMKEQREAEKQTRKEVAQKLKPSGEVVLALIEKHKEAARNVSAVTTSDIMSDKEAGELLRSQRKIYAFLLQFEAEIKLALKETK